MLLLIIKGFELANGNQCQIVLSHGNPICPFAVCINGAINLAITGNTRAFAKEVTVASDAFYKITGCDIIGANNGIYDGQNGKPMSFLDIAGILAAEGF